MDGLCWSLEFRKKLKKIWEVKNLHLNLHLLLFRSTCRCKSSLVHNSYIFTDIICSMLCTSSSNASSLLTCLPQLGSTDGVDCAVKTEVRGCASDKPHSVYFRNVQNLDTVISYRHSVGNLHGTQPC